ncbi:hypothetical protein [Actinomyces vulturis]|uniref:hypothetical protein n=1 Tax=Actinomyces vulturis TaxID=1857645 RepID=UPI00082B4294|nr:hypothetical protein [Actinomyces vulturis]
MNETAHERALTDSRRSALGFGRLVVVLTAITGAVTFVPSFVHIIRETTSVRSDITSMVAGLAFIVLSISLAHNGRRMRWVGWGCFVVTVLGFVVVNALGAQPQPTAQSFIDGTVWAQWGEESWFLTLLTPIVAGAWLWWSDPRRIVVNAERIQDISGSVGRGVLTERKSD